MFNSIIRNLVRTITSRLPDEGEFGRLNRRIALAIDEAPESVIQNVGPYLLKYHQQIEDHDEDFFIMRDYEEECKGDTSLVSNIIPKAKDAFQTFTPDERADFFELVGELYAHYLEYLSAARGLG